MYFNQEFRSKNFRPRNGCKIEYIILHATNVPLATTKAIFCNNPELAKPDLKYFQNADITPETLCKNQTSAHYVVDEDGEIYNFVDDEQVAYHAGKSYWDGKTEINNYSIGIECINLGHNYLNYLTPEQLIEVDGMDLRWAKFVDVQITKIAELCKFLIKKYNIQSYNILAHSDIAVARKLDPGPLFPWQYLTQQGIGIWFDTNESNLKPDKLPEQPILWAQNKLREFGYYCETTGIEDQQAIAAFQALQLHFRANNINGKLDLETMRIIDSLCLRKQELLVKTKLATTDAR